MGICSNCGAEYYHIRKTFCAKCYCRFVKWGDPNCVRRSSNEDKLPHVLTDIQHQILIGSMLGDGHMSLADKCRYPILKIARTIKDEDYLLWEYNQFKELCSAEPRYDINPDGFTGKNHESILFKTRSVPAFLPYYHQWYINKIKIVPQTLTLTPLIVAVWFADDGSVWTKNTSIKISLATNGFEKKYTEFLCNLLNTTIKEKINMYNTGNKDQYFLYLTSRAASKFIKYISPVYDQLNLSRKSDVWKNLDLNIFDDKKYDYSTNDVHLELDYLINKCKELQSFYLNDLVELIKKDIGKIPIKRTLRKNLDKLVSLNCLSKQMKSVNDNNFYKRNKYCFINKTINALPTLPQPQPHPSKR